MRPRKILILDYSVTRDETPAVKRWLPADTQVSALYIDTEGSFPDELISRDFTHVIHSGSALSITKTAPFTSKAVDYIRSARDKGVSQFGICYGHQLVCLALVGESAVRSSPNGLEAGWGSVTLTSHARSILGVGETEVVWQMHFDEVTEMPEGSELLATNAHTEIQAYINRGQRIVGTQFHPEFDKEAGDKAFLQDRELLERNNYDVSEIVAGGPSIEAGRIFFNYFLGEV